MNTDFEKMTDKELEAYKSDINKELTCRRESERKDREIKQLKLAKVFHENKDVFLATMEHYRTSCSDDNPCNEGRCCKCDFMSLEDWEFECDSVLMWVDSCKELRFERVKL